LKPPRRGVSQVDRADRGSTESDAPAVASANPAKAGSSVIGSVKSAELDIVDEALAYAIKHAVDDRLWERVGQLVRELEARRLARVTCNIVDLTAARSKRS
jgi:hypothetical protein